MSEVSSKNWFARHKILTVVLVLIILGIIGSASGASKSTSTTSSSTDSSAPIAATATPKPKLDIAGFYAKVQNGMTKDQVVALADKDPGSCTESEMQGLGKYEYCSWYGSFGDNAFASVTFKDGLVQSKSKTGF